MHRAGAIITVRGSWPSRIGSLGTCIRATLFPRTIEHNRHLHLCPLPRLLFMPLSLPHPRTMTHSSSTAHEPEEAPLLAGTDDNGSQNSNSPEVSSGIKQRLYVSHFLSTWNSRVFEFGAVLYLANVFPNTLLPMSTYALTRSAVAILLSPAIGQYIDTGNRLQVVRLSIGNLTVQKVFSWLLIC